MQSSIRIDRDVPGEMRDGTMLRADIYQPDDKEKHPAILVCTPYNKGSTMGVFIDIIDAVSQ